MLGDNIVNSTSDDRLTGSRKISAVLEQLFFLLPIFKIAILESFPKLDKLYSFWGAFSLLILIAVGIRQNRKEKKAFLYTALLIVFCAIYCVMTKVYTSEALLGSISQSIRLLLFPYYMLAYRHTDFGDLLDSLSKFFKVILFLDSVSIFLNFDGELRYSLLGLDNTVIFTIIPALTIIMFNDYYRNESISNSSVVLLLVCYIGKLYTHAISACIAMLIFIPAILCTLSPKKKALVKTTSIFINPTIMFGFFIAFTAMTLLFDVTPLVSAIFSPFGKNGTMNGRTRIWSLTAASIIRNPIFGHGQAYPGYFQSIIGLDTWDTAATHTHNFLLELLWSTGIIGTAIYMFIFIKSVSMLYKYRNVKMIRLLGCGITAFSVLMITDSYIMQPTIMILCFLCLNIEKIMIQKGLIDSTDCESS